MHQPTDKNAVWLNTTETILLVGSVGTSVASVVLQQVTFAAITSVQLSLVLGLNSLNRKRFDDLNQQNQNAIAQIQQQLLKEQSSVHQIEASIRQLPTHQDITTLQQLNESAIAKIQQQFLKETTSANQIESTIRQLPTYQDIAAIQQQLEQLKTDHPKQLSQINQDIIMLQRELEQLKADHPKQLSQINQDIEIFQQQLEQLKTDHRNQLNQLNEDINNQEHQFNQIHIGLNSLRQKADSALSINTDISQNRIHELKGYFDIKLRVLEEKINQSATSQLEIRIFEIEEAVHAISNLLHTKNLDNIFSNHAKEIQDLKTKTSQLSHLINFDPQILQDELQRISKNIQGIEEIIQEAQAMIFLGSIIQKDDSLYESEFEEIKFLQEDVNELDRRIQKAGQDFHFLRNELEANSSNVTQRFQKIHIDIIARFNELKREIQDIRSYIKIKVPLTKVIENTKIPSLQVITCYRCGKECDSPLIGGLMNNRSFCSKTCMKLDEDIDGKNTYY